MDTAKLAEAIRRARQRAHWDREVWAMIESAWRAGVTIHELADLCGVTTRTVQRWRAKYGWPRHRRGRRRQVPGSEP